MIKALLISCLFLTACVPAVSKTEDTFIHTHTIQCVKFSDDTCIEYKVFKVVKE